MGQAIDRRQEGFGVYKSCFSLTLGRRNVLESRVIAPVMLLESLLLDKSGPPIMFLELFKFISYHKYLRGAIYVPPRCLHKVAHKECEA